MLNKALFGGMFIRTDSIRILPVIESNYVRKEIDQQIIEILFCFVSRTKNNKTFAELVYGVHIRRRPLYYIFNVIIPCAMLSCLTCMSFW